MFNMLTEKQMIASIVHFANESVQSKEKSKDKKMKDDSLYCFGIVTGLITALGKHDDFIKYILDKDNNWVDYVLNLESQYSKICEN